MTDRGFKGIWIPSAVWLSRDLTLLEKCFFAEIDSLDNGDRGCVASNKYLSDFFGLGKEYVSRQISKLEAKKLIECTYDSDSNRTIRVTRKGRLFLADLPESEYERKPDPGHDPAGAGGVVQTDKGGCPNGQGGLSKRTRGGCPNGQTYNKGDNKGDNKGEEGAQAPAPKRSRSVFTAPTAEEAEAYFAEISAPGEGERFTDYHASRGWIVGKSPMKDWKAAARTWRANAERFGGSGGSAARPSPAAGGAALIKEVEAALNNRAYFQQIGYSAEQARQVVKSQNLPVWSDPAIGAAVDALGGFFKLRERVTQGTLPDSVWKPQIERYYRQEKEAA